MHLGATTQNELTPELTPSSPNFGSAPTALLRLAG